LQTIYLNSRYHSDKTRSEKSTGGFQSQQGQWTNPNTVCNKFSVLDVHFNTNNSSTKVKNLSKVPNDRKSAFVASFNEEDETKASNKAHQLGVEEPRPSRVHVTRGERLPQG
jgi:hypothetical protein